MAAMRLSCAILVSVSILLIASLYGAPPDANLSEYQVEVHRVREELYGKVWDDLATPPKLDDATRQRLKGKLLELDPYWRLQQQLIDDLNAFGPHHAGDATLSARAAAYVDILPLIRILHRVPPTKKQAEAEAAKLRICLLRADFAAVEKLLQAWAK